MVSSRRLAAAILTGVVFALGVGTSDTHAAQGDGPVTISMLADAGQQVGYDVLIANFERVYPSIKVNATYEPTTTWQQLETTELAAGNAPDLLAVGPGCGEPTSVCVLAKAGFLAPMITKPWTKWSLPLVTSLDKYGRGLYVFSPQVTPIGVFTNDALFSKLGLKVPQTFSQLLDVCQQAKAAGTAAVIQSSSGVAVASFVERVAAATVYLPDKHWTSELQAGTVSFDGTPGWHQALQELVDMYTAGCFEPGFLGTNTPAAAQALFAQGQGLMFAAYSSMKGAVDAFGPQFSYSFHPTPAGSSPSQTATYLNLSGGVGVNAHSNAANQAAAQTFVDFIARPKQNALFTQVEGGLSQYEFLKGQIPSFMSAFAPIFQAHAYIVIPQSTWWNPNVLLALQQNGIGVLTGQRSIDDVLNAMDAAWKQGPA